MLFLHDSELGSFICLIPFQPQDQQVLEDQELGQALFVFQTPDQKLEIDQDSDSDIGSDSDTGLGTGFFQESALVHTIFLIMCLPPNL